MAKDDYFVIVYQLLKYLYECLKRGVQPDINMLDPSTFNISESYWDYVMKNLIEDGYIEGVRIVQVDGADRLPLVNLNEIQITPVGIEYLESNSSIQKAMKFMQNIKSSLPFI